MVRYLSALLLLCYAFVIANLTLMDPSSGQWAFSRADHLAGMLADGQMPWSETEVLANVALFVPVGFLLVLVLRRLLLAVLLGVLGSVFIETFQAAYLPLRVGTPADVVHNGWGVVLGAALASPYWLVVLRQRARVSTSAATTPVREPA